MVERGLVYQSVGEIHEVLAVGDTAYSEVGPVGYDPYDIFPYTVNCCVRLSPAIIKGQDVTNLQA